MKGDSSWNLESSSTFQLTLTADLQSPGSLFSAREVDNLAATELVSARAVQLKQGKMYIERGTTAQGGSSGSRIFICGATPSKTKAVNLVMAKYADISEGDARLSRGAEKNRSSAIHASAQKLSRSKLFAPPLDVYVGSSMRRHFDMFLRLMKLPRNHRNGRLLPQVTVFPEAESYEKNLFPELVDRVNMFVQGYPVACRKLHECAAYQQDKALKQSRQNLLREQGLIDILLRMLNILKPLATVPPEQLAAAADDEGYGQTISGQAVMTACLRLLLLCVHNNGMNQRYVARSIVVVIALIGVDPLAGLLVTEVLSGDDDLRASSVGVQEIKLFVDKMRSTEMKPTYLQLLQSLAAFNGTGVPRIQAMVYDALFAHNPELLISFEMQYPSSGVIGTGSSGPDKSHGGHDSYRALGSSIAKLGAPVITIRYNSSFGDNSKFDFKNAFAKEAVELKELFFSMDAPGPMIQNTISPIPVGSENRRASRAIHPTIITKNQLRKTRRQIAEFLIEQMNLASDLCVGRNYAIISKMEAIYPIELLMGIFTNHSFRGDELRSAAVRLLLCLYIDRDPDTPAVLPRLVRAAKEIKTFDKTVIVSLATLADKENRSEFLQECLVRILEDEMESPYGSLSFQVMQVIHKLLIFGYYGTVPKFKSIMQLVCQSLNRRSIERILDEGNRSANTFKAESIQLLMRRSQQFSRAASTLGSKTSSQRNGSSTFASVKNQIMRKRTSVLNPVQTRKNEREKDTHHFLVPPSDIRMQPDSARQVTIMSDGEAASEAYETFLRAAAFVLDIMDTATYNVVTFPLIIMSVILIIDALDLIKISGAYEITLVIYAYFLMEFIIRLVFYWFVRTIDEYVNDVMNFVDLIVIISSTLGLLFRQVPSRVVVFFYGVRVLRAGRLLRVARAINKLKDNASVGTHPLWTEDARYSKSHLAAIHTLRETLEILASAQRFVEDRTLSLLMQKFSYLREERKLVSVEELSRVIRQGFEEVCKEAHELVAYSPTIDETLLDLLMYSPRSLVESTIHVLMARYSSRKILVRNTSKLHFLVEEERQTNYSKLTEAYEHARHYVAIFNSWKNLAADPHHHITFLQTCKCFHALQDACRQRCTKIVFGEEFEPVKSVQDILFNMGCFDLCIKTILLYQDENGSRTDSAEILDTARAVAGAGNAFFAALMKDNKEIQSLAFKYLQVFVNNIDEGIGSDDVITAIFSNNEHLKKDAPKQYLYDFLNLIIVNGRKPQYLCYLDAIVSDGNVGIRENQYEVIRLLTPPETQSHFFKFLVPVKHPKYIEKVRLMAPFLGSRDVRMSELPIELQYHLKVVQLLHKCTIGVEGMTSIEAMVQSFSNFVDLVDGMLDPKSILLAKIHFGLYLESAILDVEMKVPRVKDADCIWRLFACIPDVLSQAKGEIHKFDRQGLQGGEGTRQIIEYAVVLIHVVHSYFKIYYEPSVYKEEIDSSASWKLPRAALTLQRIDSIIQDLHDGILAIKFTQSEILSTETYKYISETLHILAASSSVSIVHNSDAALTIVKLSPRPHWRKSGLEAKPDEKMISMMFSDFVATLKSDSVIKRSVEDETIAFIERFERFPLQNDQSSDSTLRFEPILAKLIEYVRGSIVINSDDTRLARTLTDGSTPQCIWVLQVFRQMIEMKWGMSIDDRDEEGGAEQDESVKDLMDTFREKEVPSMCVDLVARGIDSECQAEALKLLVGMLFKEGGALEVQKAINNHLSRPRSEYFFQHIHSMLQSLISWHKNQGIIAIHDNEEPELPRESIALRFLQLSCEGHFQANQDMLREQPLNTVSVNILDDLVQYLDTLAGIHCQTSTKACLDVCSTILEVIQGPCAKNQDHFVFKTHLVETLNRKIRSLPSNDCDVIEEIKLKKLAIDIFEALLEGQGQKKDIYERLLSVVHLDVIATICTKDIKQSHSEGDGNDEDDEKEQDKKAISEEYVQEMKALQTECLVFMEMIFDFKPSLRRDLGLDHLKINELDVGCVEVIWNGVLQRRFFNIPDICNDLSVATKDRFVLYVDRSSDDNKRYGLMEAAQGMYKEILHQQVLKDLNVAKIFDRTNQERCKWVTFSIILTINVLFLAFYGTDVTSCPTTAYPDNVCTTPEMPDAVEIVVTVLQVLTIVSSAFTMIQYVVVHVPVIYQSNQLICKGDRNKTILRTAQDPFLIYYIALVSLIWTSFYVRDITPLLLLDIVAISPAVQGILMVTWIPRMALFFALFLTVVVIYIYSAFAFFLYADSDGVKVPENFDSLADSFKEYVRYGSFAGAIVSYGDYALVLGSGRYILDVSFFMATFILWNIVRGITFDQFVVVREANLNRISDTNNKCFICGLEAGVFNRAFGRGAFEKHIEKEHNLWNYIYYIIFLWEQDKDDDDGLESTIRRSVATMNVSWFPAGRSVSLLNVADDEEEIDDRLKVHLRKFEDDFKKKIVKFKNHMDKSISRVETALIEDPDKDHTPSNPKTMLSSPRKRDNMISSHGQSIHPLKSIPMLFSKSGNIVNKMGMSRKERSSSVMDEIAIEICIEKLAPIWLEADKKDRIVCRIASTSSTYHVRAMNVETVSRSDSQLSLCDKRFRLHDLVFNQNSFTDGLTLEETDSMIFGGGIEDLLNAEEDLDLDDQELVRTLGASFKGLSFNASKDIDSQTESFSPLSSKSGGKSNSSRSVAKSRSPSPPQYSKKSSLTQRLATQSTGSHVVSFETEPGNIRNPGSAEGSSGPSVSPLRHAPPQLKGALVNEFSRRAIAEGASASSGIDGSHAASMKAPFSLRINPSPFQSLEDPQYASHRSPRIMAAASARQDAHLKRFTAAEAHQQFFTVFRGKSSVFSEGKNSVVRIIFYLDTVGTSEVATYLGAAETTLYDLAEAASDEVALELDVQSRNLPEAFQVSTKLTLSVLVSSTGASRQISTPGSRSGSRPTSTNK
jgi:hypothetical protein